MRTKATIIVVIATVVYSVLGGIIFHAIEQGYETGLLPKVLEEFNQYASADANGTSCLNWTDMIQLKSILMDLTNGGLYITQSGQIINGTKWDIKTAIFAAVSVFTTVGIRSLGPDFLWGRVFAIIYSWLGVALFFCAGKTSEKIRIKLLKTIGRRLYGSVALRTFTKLIMQAVLLIIEFILLVLIPAVIFSKLEQWNYAVALFFCFSTFLTIGFVDYVPGFNHDLQLSEDDLKWYHLATAFWVLIITLWFLSYMISFVSFIDDLLDRSESRLEKTLTSGGTKEVNSNNYSKALDTQGLGTQIVEINDEARS